MKSNGPLILLTQHNLIQRTVFGVSPPSVIIYYLALKEKREFFYNGKLTWKQGFIVGMVMTVIVTVISPLTQYIIHTLNNSRLF